jgi:type VI secretion system protein ImpA
MPLKNLDSLLQPVSADAPCGVDLEYDPAFLELERLSESKPEQQMGSTIVAAQEPDWKEVANRALPLFAKTKDLRIAVKLTRALMQTEGLTGFADGLGLMRGIVETFWDGFFPKLDPDDGNDPTFRVNILMGLCDGPMFIDRLRLIPLVTARSFGRFSLRDMAIASGEIPAAVGAPAPSTSSIDGAFSECPVDDLQTTADALHSALDSLKAVESFVGDKVGASNGPNFAKLTDLLRSAEKIMAVRLLRRGVGVEAAAADAVDADTAAGTAPSAAVLGRAMTGEINSRDDVIRVLDKICAYYERVEPSSPIPILLKRSKRLVSASFLDIVRDLAPDGLTQVENIRGKDPSESS